MNNRLKGDAAMREVAKNAAKPPQSVPAVTDGAETTVIKLPGAGMCLYTTAYVILVISGVAALWVCAVGMWWIKYYIECNQGVKVCNLR